MEFLCSMFEKSVSASRNLGVAHMWFDAFFISIFAVLFFSMLLNKKWNLKKPNLRAQFLQKRNADVMKSQLQTSSSLLDDGLGKMSSSPSSNPKNFVATLEHLVSLFSNLTSSPFWNYYIVWYSCFIIL
jgi:hypothetical protein